MLPKLNGYKVLEELRRRGVWTPVLMLTAKDGEYDQTDAFDLGADDYLTKPFSFLVLVARLRALIRRGAPERPVVLAAGDLTLDPARRRVERAGEEISVTPREYGRRLVRLYWESIADRVCGGFVAFNNVSLAPRQ